MKLPSISVLFACGIAAGITGNAIAAADTTATLARGEYLATIGGCHDCHTPLKIGAKGPEPDMRKKFAGHPADLKMPPAPDVGNGGKGPWLWIGAATNTAFAGPWGVTYAANLTSDKATGLGSWRGGDFVKAMRTGKHAGVGRDILPPMPWQNYARMTEMDLRSLFSYLQSVPAMKNAVPPYSPPNVASTAKVNERVSMSSR